MIDFTLNAYKAYLDAISNSYSNIITFDRYLREGKSLEAFCIIRHDVDRRPYRALNMAEIEHTMGISSTYYFRFKNHTFIPDIISDIYQLGHEIGYHYESLSDAQGNMESAFRNFEYHLSKFNKIVPVSTIAMHGRPFSPHNNIDMWKDPERRKVLHERYGILGEVYINIDYSNVLYMTDTGRNWKMMKSNRRDHVLSNISLEFETGKQFVNYLKAKPHPKLILQIHPERWTDNLPAYAIQWIADKITNLAKSIQCLRK